MRLSALRHFLTCAAVACASVGVSAAAAPAKPLESYVADAKSAMMSDPASALRNAKAAYNLASRLRGKEGQLAVATSHWLQAEALTRMGEPKSALPEVEAGLAAISGHGTKLKLRADLLKAKASALSKTGNPQGALNLLHSAFAIYRDLGEPRAQAIILQNIGSIYYDARDYQRMLDYLQQAMVTYDDDQALSVALHTNRGNALKELGRFTEADSEYQKALGIARAMKSAFLQANILSNLAASQLSNNRLEQANATAQRGLQIAVGPAAEVRPGLLGTAAQIAFRRGQIEAAAEFIDECFIGVDLASSTTEFRDHHETAYQIYARIGRPDLALAHLAAFKRIDDNGYRLAASTNTALMTAQFDSANKELQISRLEAQKAQRELALSHSEARAKGYSIILILGGIASLAIILAMAFAFVIARKRRQEITENNERLAYAANHDPLTDLPNRKYFKELTEGSLRNAIDADQRCAILMIDLDRFKWVNDTHGHNAGDELLCAVSSALTSAVGDQGTAVRLGGDEFAILVPVVSTGEDLDKLASDILTELRSPFQVAETPVHIGGTIGIAIGPIDADNLTDLVRNADLALYAGKDGGRNRAVRFDRSMLDAIAEQRSIHADLKSAIERGELKIVYQAIVDMAGHETVGYEALVRWEHPVLGDVSPARFIAIAEETGLIGALGDWVLRTACAEAVNWPQQQFLSVNLSALQVANGGLIGHVMNALAASGLAPDRLELEITEGAFLGQESAADQTLGQLRALGVRLSLDDFGTGSSSLSYLQKAKFSTVKIDRSFVRLASEGSNESIAIIRAIIALAREMGIATTAEGVETAEQRDCMAKLGCTQGQGYLFAKPMAAPSETLQQKAKAA